MSDRIRLFCSAALAPKTAEAKRTSALHLMRSNYFWLVLSRSNLQQGFYAVAVTRAYYAMFYAATALLESQGISGSRQSGVVAAFGEHFVKTGLMQVDYAKMSLLSAALYSRSGLRANQGSEF